MVFSRTKVALLVATMACVLAVAVVLVASAWADGASATVTRGDSSTANQNQGHKGGLDPALEESLEAEGERLGV